jgi:hypothetical protein
MTKDILKRMIQEELRLVLVLPHALDVEPRDVTDAFHPEEVVPREEAWAGGDNIEDSLDHARFETGESNSGPHSSISWSHDPDSLTPGEAAGVGYAACKSDLGINEKKIRGRKMRKLSKLNRMIIEEGIKLLREGHGCKCAQCSKCSAQDDIISMADMHGIMPSDVGTSSLPVQLDSDSAFGAGYSMGQDEREEFDYTGDLSDLTPEEAMGLGHQAGMMGLGHEDEGPDSAPHSESYAAVRSFLQANPDLVDMAAKKLMKMAGASCPKSTRMAVVDHLTAEPQMGMQEIDIASLVGGGT